MKLSILLKAQLFSKNSELSNYRKRLEQVQSIQRTLNSCCFSDADDINSRSNQAIESFANGVQPYSYINNICNKIRKRSDKGISDGSISCVLSELGKEVLRINREIEELQREINSLNTKISNAVANEKAAEAAQKAAAYK